MNARLLVAVFFLLGSAALQGCYTQFGSIREERADFDDQAALEDDESEFSDDSTASDFDLDREKVYYDYYYPGPDIVFAPILAPSWRWRWGWHGWDPWYDPLAWCGTWYPYTVWWPSIYYPAYWYGGFHTPIWYGGGYTTTEYRGRGWGDVRRIGTTRGGGGRGGVLTSGGTEREGRPAGSVRDMNLPRGTTTTGPSRGDRKTEVQRPPRDRRSPPGTTGRGSWRQPESGRNTDGTAPPSRGGSREQERQRPAERPGGSRTYTPPPPPPPQHTTPPASSGGGRSSGSSREPRRDR